MWLCLNDAFLSIVHKECARDELLVRARRQGDIEKVFPGAKVKRSLTTDYLFRAVIKRDQVEAAMIGEVRRINYANFKGSVPAGPLHDAYLRCWTAMSDLQPTRPYTGLPRGGSAGGGFTYDVIGSGGGSGNGGADLFEHPRNSDGTFGAKKPRRRKKRRSIKRGR